MSNFIRNAILSMLILLAGAARPAFASLVANGVTYTLNEAQSSLSSGATFNLSISGINGPFDTEGHREGVYAIAFNPPATLSSNTAPAGFKLSSGGLAAGGCNGHGNFFCYQALSLPAAVLPLNSTLNFSFYLGASSFLGYVPDFKIDWVGLDRHYSLVSNPLNPTEIASSAQSSSSASVPAPAVVGLFGLAVLVQLLLGALRRHRTR